MSAKSTKLATLQSNLAATVKSLPAADEIAIDLTLWRKFTRFVRDADELVDALGNIDGDYRSRSALWGWVSDRLGTLEAKVSAGWQFFDAESCYDAEGVLSQSHVAWRLLVMFLSFPEGSAANAQIFTHTLLAHVLDAEPSPLALETCCRDIVAEREKKPPPTNVFLQLLRKHDKRWDKRWAAMLRAREVLKHITELKHERART
jgi:hypothetical protein